MFYFLFSHLDWNMVHGNDVVTLDGDVLKRDSAVFPLPKDIDSYLFSKFARQYFRVWILLGISFAFIDLAPK